MTRARTILSAVTLGLFALVVIGYAAFELRAFFEGPALTITTPVTGDTLPSTLTYIEGTARHVSFLYLNGRQIFTDETGNFREYLLLPKGYNVVTVEAVGRFNRKVVETIELISP